MTLTVRHARGEYPVLIAPGAMGRLAEVAAERLAGRRLVLVTDEHVAPRLEAWGFPAGLTEGRAGVGRLVRPILQWRVRPRWYLVALLTNLDAEQDDPQGEQADAIRLSTIHQAKGLEWEVVFVLWLAEGMFPSGRSLNDAESESEERRLFYVATTRARDALHLCVPALRRARDGGVQYYGPSRFIMELPGRLTREDQVHAW